MNRSFRSHDSFLQVKARAVKQRDQFGASITKLKAKEDELALFLEMKRREKEKEQSRLLLNHTEEFDSPLESEPGTSRIFNISSSAAPARRTGADDLLNPGNDENDYDWLLMPPSTPLFPSLEMGSHNTITSQIGPPKAHPTPLKSSLANPQREPAARTTLLSKQPTSSPGLNVSGAGMHRPSSPGGTGSRSVTPMRCTILTTGSSKFVTSSTPSSWASLPLSRPAVSVTKPAASAVKPTVPARPSRPTTRSSTPQRPSVPPSKFTTRTATPTRHPSARSIAAAPLTKLSPSVAKPVPTSIRNPVPSRNPSPLVKSRVLKPSETPSFSLKGLPNLRTPLPERPLSSTRSRPGAHNSCSSLVELPTNGRPRLQSCSPLRGRAPNGIMHTSGSSVPAVKYWHSKVSDNVSPVLIGTKMVERVINMRKLAPPTQDDKHTPHGKISGKSSPGSSGFGRTLSKKSLDMAIRHMDIRRSIPGNLRPLMTTIPTSPMYGSVRSGSTRSRAVSVEGSPHGTSGNASSEMSVNNNGLCPDGVEVDDNIDIERGGHSPPRGGYGT